MAVEFAAGQRSAHCALCQHPLPGALPPNDAAAPAGDADGEAAEPESGQFATSSAEPAGEERNDDRLGCQQSSGAERRLEHAVAGFKAEPPCWDDWELEDALARARWAAQSSNAWRADATHAAGQEPVEPRDTTTAAPSAGGVLAWLTACLGLTAVAFGGVVLGWSLLGHRADLWNIGLLAALAGQPLLVLGLFGYYSSRRRSASAGAAAAERPEWQRPPGPLPWPQQGAAVLHAPLPEEPAGPSR